MIVDFDSRRCSYGWVFVMYFFKVVLVRECPFCVEHDFSISLSVHLFIHFPEGSFSQLSIVLASRFVQAAIADLLVHF